MRLLLNLIKSLVLVFLMPIVHINNIFNVIFNFHKMIICYVLCFLKILYLILVMEHLLPTVLQFFCLIIFVCLLLDFMMFLLLISNMQLSSNMNCKELYYHLNIMMVKMVFNLSIHKFLYRNHHSDRINVAF